jgi:acyl-CoA synthetase (AMP-forming)/AMP-acid ligase II
VFTSSNLREALARGARDAPGSGLTVFDRRGRSTGRRSYTEVLQSAIQTAGRLAARGVLPGDRVVVALPTSFDWFDVWLGAIQLGALPVATAPGAAVGASRVQLDKLLGVVDNLSATLIVSTDSLTKKIAEEPARALPLPPCITPAALAETPAGGFAPEPSAPQDTAFLQLTSGSTGFPRAVQITHGGAMHNAHALDVNIAAPHRPTCRGFIDHWVSWVPLYHDMGLITNLTLMLNGIDLDLMPPEAFLGRPRRWLELLSSAGNGVATAPNFGYQLCIDRLGEQDLEGLDLARWQAAFSAAEMVRPETVTGFLDRFGGCGFKPENYRPCYGLAEATLVVAIDQAGKAPRTLPVPTGATDSGFELREVFCLGEPVIDTRIEITAPDGSTLPEGTVGEVRVNGPSVFSGYYNDPEATAQTLVDGWPRNGDLGLLVAGELYLTGRLKDLLIVRGENIMPHELEWMAESVSGGGGLERAAAFSISRGGQGEEVVLVLETNEKDPERLDQTLHRLRIEVGREFGLTLADVVPVKRGQLPKTTSGKVQRGVVRDLYLASELVRLVGPD